MSFLIENFEVFSCFFRIFAYFWPFSDSKNHHNNRQSIMFFCKILRGSISSFVEIILSFISDRKALKQKLFVTNFRFSLRNSRQNKYFFYFCAFYFINFLILSPKFLSLVSFILWRCYFFAFLSLSLWKNAIKYYPKKTRKVIFVGKFNPAGGATDVLSTCSASSCIIWFWKKRSF